MSLHTNMMPFTKFFLSLEYVCSFNIVVIDNASEDASVAPYKSTSLYIIQVLAWILIYFH